MNLCEPMCLSECKAAGKYSGYSGAFKCLMDGVGEVAFVKHTTVMENVNASDASNYRYLCNDGSRAGTYFFKTGVDDGGFFLPPPPPPPRRRRGI